MSAKLQRLALRRPVFAMRDGLLAAHSMSAQLQIYDPVPRVWMVIDGRNARLHRRPSPLPLN